MSLLADVGLTSFAEWTAAELPYGRKRALEIATTLALDPEMLLLDEPMAGMGHEDIDRISALIKAVSADRTVLMISHRLSTLGHVDEIIVLEDGAIAERGTPSALRKSNGVFARMLAEQNRYNGSTRRRPTSIARPRDNDADAG